MMETIGWRIIDHEGRALTVSVVRDDDETPFDAECYTAEDIDAWRRDEWIYVGVLINEGATPLDSLWGLEFGSLATVEITIDTLVDVYPVPDMLVGIGS